MKRTGNSKIAVVGWGRGMGHKGHMYLADAVITQATNMKADPYFFVSKTVGKDDPVFPEEKVRIYQKVFPQYAPIFTPEGNLNQALQELAQLGYQGVVVVVGADQKKAFQYLEGNNKEGVPVYQSLGLKKLRVISRQETNSKFANEEGPRATPMREILLDPNASEEDKFNVWRRDMPEQLSDREVLDVMNKAESRLIHSNKPKVAKVKAMSKKVAKLKEAIMSFKVKKSEEQSEKDTEPFGYKHLFKQPGEPEQKPVEKHYRGWEEYEKEQNPDAVEEGRIIDANAKVDLYYVTPKGARQKIFQAIPQRMLDKAIAVLQSKYPNINPNDIEMRPAGHGEYTRTEGVEEDPGIEEGKKKKKKKNKSSTSLRGYFFPGYAYYGVGYSGEGSGDGGGGESVAEGSDPYADGYNAWKEYLSGKTNRYPKNPYPAGKGMSQWEAGAAKAAEGRDFISGSDQGMAEGSEEVDTHGRTKAEWVKAVHAKYPMARVIHNKDNTQVMAVLPNGKEIRWIKDEGIIEQGIAEAGFTKTPSGDYINQHTGVRSSKPPVKKKRGEKTGAEWDAIEKAKKDKEQGVAEADKHSMLGKIQRGHELKKKVDSTFKDIGNAQKQGDHPSASKAFRKHERYANLERPGTWTKVDEEGVAEGIFGSKKPQEEYDIYLKGCDPHAVKKYLLSKFGSKGWRVFAANDGSGTVSAHINTDLYPSEIEAKVDLQKNCRQQGVTEDDVWGPQGNFAGDKPVELGNVTMKQIRVGDTVMYIDQKAKVLAMSKDRKYSRIGIQTGMGGITKDVLTSDLKQLGQGVVNEFAPDDSGDNGQEDMFFKYAKLWYNGNLKVQQRVEEILAQAGWEIGPLESEEGGAFIVQSGDENGDTYMGWSAQELQGIDESSTDYLDEK